MDEIENLFRQEDNQFTVFVVEKSFVEDRGNQYFKQLRDTFHYFDTDEKIGLSSLLVGNPIFWCC